jgi:putative oxidoreductase
MDLFRNLFQGAEPTIRPGNWAALPVRLVSGLIFVYYGADKLFLNAQYTGMDASFFAALGIPFPELNVVLIGALEFFGGLALVGGFLTKLFAFLMIGNMGVAMLTSQNFIIEGPLFAMAVALLLYGAGPLSVDALLGRSRLPGHGIFNANAVLTARPAGWGSLPLRVAVSLVFLSWGLDKLLGGATPGPADLVAGGIALVAAGMLVAGLLTKPFALLGLIPVLIDMAGQGTLDVRAYFVDAPMLAMLLAIFLAGAGPFSLDYVVGATLGRSRSDTTAADPAINYGR